MPGFVFQFFLLLFVIVNSKSVLLDSVLFIIITYPTLNCQSEVRIFEVKNEKYPKFTLTKDGVIYVDISRFSEPEEAATNEVGMTLTGW